MTEFEQHSRDSVAQTFDPPAPGADHMVLHQLPVLAAGRSYALRTHSRRGSRRYGAHAGRRESRGRGASEPRFRRINACASAVLAPRRCLTRSAGRSLTPSRSAGDALGCYPPRGASLLHSTQPRRDGATAHEGYTNAPCPFIRPVSLGKLPRRRPRTPRCRRRARGTGGRGRQPGPSRLGSRGDRPGRILGH